MNRMPIISIVVGVLLDLVGIFAYVATGSTQKTALIPCIIGMLIFVAGVLATRPSFLKHAMHAAAVIALLGFLAGAGRFSSSLLSLLKGGEAKWIALFSVGSMTVLCGFYLALCVRSFIEARRAREHAARSIITH
jgi:hypothetical protein